MSDDAKQESFEEFKNSFAYGSRTDLNFKFLADLSDQEAARFIQELLSKLGDVIDDARFDRIVDHVYEWQIEAYAGEGSWTYIEGPFTPLRKPCRSPGWFSYLPADTSSKEMALNRSGSRI